MMDSSLLANLLVSNPLKVAFQCFVSLQCIKRVEHFTQHHLVVLLMNTAMALATDVNSRVEFSFAVVFTKVGSAV